MIVADTCLITHLFNQTSLTSIAGKILKKDSDWIFPTIWKEEYANVLSKIGRKEKQHIDVIIRQFTEVEQKLRNFEYVVDIKNVLRTSLTYKISVYDAHFVSLAIDHHINLITEDKEILKKCPKIALSMEDFLIKK